MLMAAGVAQLPGAWAVAPADDAAPAVSGTVKGWGWNDAGQCNAPYPNSDFIAVSGGGSFSLGLKADGSIVGWGENLDGQCNPPAPNSGYTAISAGFRYSLALRSDGTVEAWGTDYEGETDVPAPNTGFVAISASHGYTCMGLKEDGSVVVWGDDHSGQHNVPAPNSGFTAVSAGRSHCLALRSDGTVEAWGDNSFGSCAVPFLNRDHTAIDAGDDHSLAIRPPLTWYMAEGSTGGGMETYVLVQNPGPQPVYIDMAFDTAEGRLAPPELQGVLIRAESRSTFDLGRYADTFDISTQVTSYGGEVVCERSMYGDGRAWAHDSIATTAPSQEWFLAEGSTDGGMETWILVQNPNDYEDPVAVEFDTDTGKVSPPDLQGFSVPAHSRRSIRANDWVNSYNVAARVFCPAGEVVCERSMYGDGRTWATNSIGAAAPSREWFLAEGSTDGGMETWILVQNPGDGYAELNITFMTPGGAVPGPRGFVLAPGYRASFLVNGYVADYNVSTLVEAGRPVVCERAMYGAGRAWAHDSIGFAP